jgi:hypothetical protein
MRSVWYLGLALYPNYNWGYRRLGVKRYAFDLGKVSILLEHYQFK